MPENVANPQEAAAQSGQPGSAEQKLLAGKYKTIEELERGYMESAREAARIIAEKDTLAQKAAVLEQALSAGRTGNDQRGNGRSSAWDELTSIGLSQEQLRAAIGEVVQDALRPLAEGVNARQMIAGRHQDFGQFEGEIVQHLAANPDLKQRYDRLMGVDPGSAMELAYYSFKESRQRPSASEELKPQAGIPQSQASDRPGTATATTEDVQKAIEYAQQYKDPRPYLKLRLQGVIPDEHFKLPGS